MEARKDVLKSKVGCGCAARLRYARGGSVAALPRGGSVTVELPNPNEATGSVCFKQIELVMVTGRDGCVE